LAGEDEEYQQPVKQRSASTLAFNPAKACTVLEHEHPAAHNCLTNSRYQQISEAA